MTTVGRLVFERFKLTTKLLYRKIVGLTIEYQQRIVNFSRIFID